MNCAAGEFGSSSKYTFRDAGFLGGRKVNGTSSFRTHMSGAFFTRFFFSLKETRLKMLFPMYFSFVRIS